MRRPSARRAPASSRSRAAVVELNLDTILAHPATHRPGVAESCLQQPLDLQDQAQPYGGDRDPGGQPARQTGRRRQRPEVVQARRRRQAPDHGLVDAGLDQRVPDPVVRRRRQPGPIVAEIVEIGARQDLRVGNFGDRPVQVGLAEEAAVDGVRQIAPVGELAGVDHLEAPTVVGRVPAHPFGGLRRHRRRDRVNHDRVRNRPMAMIGQGHAVDATAHRHRGAVQAGQHRPKPGTGGGGFTHRPLPAPRPRRAAPAPPARPGPGRRGPRGRPPPWRCAGRPAGPPI